MQGSSWDLSPSLLIPLKAQDFQMLPAAEWKRFPWRKCEVHSAFGTGPWGSAASWAQPGGGVPEWGRSEQDGAAGTTAGHRQHIPMEAAQSESYEGNTRWALMACASPRSELDSGYSSSRGLPKLSVTALSSSQGRWSVIPHPMQNPEAGLACSYLGKAISRLAAESGGC